MTEYKIYGPGSSSGSPVYQEVTCNETSTDICFIVSSTTKVDDCFTDTIFEKKCMPVDLSTLFPIDCSCVSADTKPVLMSGETSWGETVWYKIKQIRDICPPEPPEPSVSCDIGDYWITKSGDTLWVNYEKITTYDYGDYADVSTEILASSANCVTGEIKVSADCPTHSAITFNYDCEGGGGGCSSGTSYYVKSITFDPPYVENEGGSVSATVLYEKVTKNTDCSETKITSALTVSAGTVSACTEYSEFSANCCSDNYVMFSLSSLTKSLSADTLYYNGRKVTRDVSIPYLEKADRNCGGECTYETTYCVDSGSVNTYYETYYGSGIWVDVGSVSDSGGRIKVTWRYYATEAPTSSLPQCQSRSYSGNDYTIISVPACKPNVASSSVSGVILYKKQTNGCTMCSAQTITDKITRQEVKMNAFIYTANQTCKCKSESISSITKVEVNNVEKCTGSITIEPSAHVITYKEDCSSAETDVSLGEMEIYFGENQSDSARRIENDYAIINQEAGPCYEKICDCTTFEFKEQALDRNCEQLTFEFPTVYIGCKRTERVKIPFYGYCNGMVEANGYFYWNGNFVCDKCQQNTSGATTYKYTFPTTDYNYPWSGATITVIQCSGGTCECDCSCE